LERKHGRIAEILPLAPLQEGLLFHALYETQEHDPYIVQLTLTLEGPLEEGRLQAGARALLERYPNLGAAFETEGLEAPVQVIPAEKRLPWERVDLSGLEEADRPGALRQWLAQEKARRFDPARPPLLRFGLIRRAAERHELVLTKNHLLSDGWSTPIILRELLALYERGGSAEGLPK